MSRSGVGGRSLGQQYAVQLALVFVVFELLVAAAVVGFLMAPMARRSAADLAGLMVLSAQTWTELPPQIRPAFEHELAKTHMLALRAEPPRAGDGEWHGPYLRFVEADLAEKTGRRRPLVRESVNGDDWYWTSLSSGASTISVGFPLARIGAQPLLTLLISSVIGIGLAGLAAAWLARRAATPLARLEEAVAEVGRGEVPELLPETGPRELAGLERGFNLMARQVRELLAARTTLLAGVSHDLRTPLARLRLALELLPEDVPPKLSARMQRDVEEMNRLIGQFLDLARGLQAEERQTVDVCGLLGQAVDDAVAGGAAIDWTPPAPWLRACRPLALRRVLDNLIQNAVRYGGAEPVAVKCEGSGAALTVRVMDRGPGIAPDELEAVFRPFYRIDSSRSTATGGSGLGLAIARQLAEANGWHIALAARPGGGTEARLTL